MPAPPRIRFLPLAAIALALVVIYFSWSQPRPPETLSREPAATSATSPAAGVTPPPADEAEPARSTTSAPAVAAARDATSVAVNGRISDRDGTPLGGISIELQPRDDETGASITRRRSDRNGEFRFESIRPGRPYQLRVAPTDEYAGHVNESLIFDAATPRLDIVLERIILVDADGIVVDTSRAPVPDFTFRLRSATTNLPDRVITSDGSGYFRLDDFPAGALEINTSGRDYYRIQGVELRTDTYNSLTLIVDHGRYRLSGIVVDSDGLPVAGARLTLKGSISAGEYHTYSFRSKTTNTEGDFAFNDLGSFRYTLDVHAAGYETQVRDHEFQSFAERLEIRLQPLPVN